MTHTELTEKLRCSRLVVLGGTGFSGCNGEFNANNRIYRNTINRDIGGEGRIHGCIIDINFFNHVYVNPIDLTVTGYWASDIIQKVVYQNIPSLLKGQCPQLYANYQKLIEGKRTDPLIPKQKQTELALLPQLYLDTDIYKASREISKMQRLGSRILTIWNETSLK